MKKLLLACCLLCSLHAFSQAITNDTLVYQSRRFAVGDTVKLAYGSGADSKYSFVYLGSALGGQYPLPATFAKSTVLIDKVYKAGGMYIIRGKSIENKLGGNKIFIQAEGAVDKKEID